MEPRWSTRNDEDSICISHAGLVEGFSCLLVDFGNWIFPFRFFYTFRSTAEKLLQWWHWTFLWTSENRKRNMERIFFSRFTSKQFFGEWSSDLHDVNIWYQDYKHIRGWDFFKALFSTFLKEAEKNSASFFVSQRIPSSTKQKNFFYFQLAYDAQSEIRSIEKPFSSALHGHPSIWNLSTCNVT